MSFIFYISHILDSNLAWTKSVIEKESRLGETQQLIRNLIHQFYIYYQNCTILIHNTHFEQIF